MAREPQIQQAEAALAAAELRLADAQRAVNSASIRAPFAGRVVERNVQIGENVTPGSVLGEIFSDETLRLEVELSLSAFQQIDQAAAAKGDLVTIPGLAGWQAKMVGSSGQLSGRSRMVTVLFELSPLSDQPAAPYQPLLGEFLEVGIPGRPFTSSYILPAQAVRPGGEVIVIDEKDRIVRTAITPVYSDPEQVVIDARVSPLKPGALVCITPIAFPANGAKVQPIIDGVAPQVDTAEDKPRGKPNRN